MCVYKESVFFFYLNERGLLADEEEGYVKECFI